MTENMRRLIQGVLAAAFIGGFALLFTACTKEGDTIYQPDPNEPKASTAPLVTVIYGKDALGDPYADDKLTDSGNMTYSRGTAEQQTLVDRLYADWQGGNSGNDNPGNSLNDVNSNVDVNNGGGGVNVVR